MATVDLTELLNISITAGEEILAVYEQDFNVETKVDHSPLTIADQRSHQVIKESLESAYPQTPVLSEEGPDVPYEYRKDWEAFWLVDPLDGTKEFINKNGEFTVNIALIEGHYPIVGAIYVPVLDTFYYGKKDLGAFKLENASVRDIRNENDLLNNSIALPEVNHSVGAKVVASRSHMSEATHAFIDRLKVEHEQVDVVSAGSSLKFCLVAEGKATYYPRFAPTMEWDTGAGQAIVEAAGGKVISYESQNRFNYNRKNLKNGWFLVKGSNGDESM